MIAVLVGTLLASNPQPWVATDAASSGRRLSARVSPVQSGSLLLELHPSWGKPRKREVQTAGELEELLGAAVEEGPASEVVLTLDTRLPPEPGAAAVTALKARGVGIELRFAGPTKASDGSMPPVIGLMKEVAVPPPLTRDELEKGLSSGDAALKACYQKDLSTNALEGRLVVSFTIAKDGAVESATVRESELNRPDIHQCIEAAVRALKFPPLRGAPLLRATWPLRFQKGAPPSRPPRPPPTSARDAGVGR